MDITINKTEVTKHNKRSKTPVNKIYTDNFAGVNVSSKKIYIDTSEGVEEERTPLGYTNEEDMVLNFFQEDFQIGYLNINERYDLFNDKSLIEMIEILADKFNIRLKKRCKPGQICNEEDDWMFNVKHPLSHNKVMTIVANTLKTNKGVTFQVFNENDEIDLNTSESFNMILRNLQRASGAKHELEEMHHNLNAAIFPASIQRFVLNVDYEDIWNSGAYMKQIPLQNLYIETPYCRDIQQQRFLIENYTVTMHQLRRMFPNNSRLEYVQESSYSKYASQTYIPEKHKIIPIPSAKNKNIKRIVIQEYWNKDLKKHAIFANGVLMYMENMKNKSYPYRKLIYREFANTEFFYGMSLVNILLPTQMTFDTLMNVHINTEILNANPSWVVSGENVGDVADSLNMPNQVLIGNDVKVTAARPATSSQGIQSASMIEKSIFNESSADELTGGSAEKYVGARVANSAQINFQTILGYFEKQITCSYIDYAMIAMEEILNTLTYKDINDMGIPVYQSLWTEEDKGLLFDITPITKEEDLIERAYKLAKLAKEKNKTLIMINPEVIKKWRWRVYPVVETEYEGTTAEKEQRMINRYQLLAQMYQYDPEMLKKITEAYSKVLFKGVDVPKGLFDRNPIVPQVGQQTGASNGVVSSNLGAGGNNGQALNTASFDSITAQSNNGVAVA